MILLQPPLPVQPAVGVDLVGVVLVVRQGFPDRTPRVFLLPGVEQFAVLLGLLAQDFALQPIAI
jgi:hypothetical protein